MKNKPYLALGLAVFVHFWIMFALTYVGVDERAHVFLNGNRLYMALVMVAPMVLVMLAFMAHMFGDTRRNVLIGGAAVVVFVLSFWAIRAQALVGDEQLMRSMIPHHSIAIKSCERSELSDPELVALCEEIVETQREEIAQMWAILDRLG